MHEKFAFKCPNKFEFIVNLNIHGRFAFKCGECPNEIKFTYNFKKNT